MRSFLPFSVVEAMVVVKVLHKSQKFILTFTGTQKKGRITSPENEAEEKMKIT